jgi:hypothetical protein
MLAAYETDAPIMHYARMPTFHFHLHNVHVQASDREGIELADLDAARAQALEGIRNFLGHEAMTGTLDLRGQVDIADDGC